LEYIASAGLSTIKEPIPTDGDIAYNMPKFEN
jgi:hypothetical protein